MTLQDSFRLEPAGSEARSFDVHWHRVLGTVEAPDGPADALVLTLTRERDGAHEWSATASDRHRIDHLIACCKDATWTAYTLTVTNRADVPVTVHAHVQALHDDFAVAAQRAEGGLVESASFFALLGATFAWRAQRNLGRALPPDQAHRAWRRAVVAWVVLVVPPTLVALVGMLRLGVAPFTGAVATLALLPRAPGPFGAVAYFGLAVVALYFLTLALLVRATGRSDGARRRLLMGGTVLSAGVVILAVVFAIEHHAVLVPLLFAGAFAGPPLWILAQTARRFPQAPGEPGPPAT